MKKILYVVPVLVIVLLGFKLKVRAANDYKYYLHEDGYVYWMPDYTDFSTNNGLFTFQEFYECANSEGLGQYSYDVSAHFSSGDVKRVEIYQDGGWYPLDSYEISHNDWLIKFNADDDDTIYTIISNDFEFWYQVDGDPLVETSLAGIRFYLAENVGQVTFDGSENWLRYSYDVEPYETIAFYANDLMYNHTTNFVVSDGFSKGNVWGTDNKNVIQLQENNSRVLLRIDKNLQYQHL